MDARVEIKNLIEQYFPNQTDQLLVREILKKYRELFLSNDSTKDTPLTEKRVREIVAELLIEHVIEEHQPEPSDIVVEEIRSLDEELERGADYIDTFLDVFDSKES